MEIVAVVKGCVTENKTPYKITSFLFDQCLTFERFKKAFTDVVTMVMISVVI